MAAKAADKSTASTSLMDSMTTEDEVNTPIRGRGYDADTLAIREELEKCLTEGKARSFQNVPEDKREDYARKVRTAGAMRGKDPIKVSTRYDKANSKLIWGPADVLKQLSSKA